VRVWRGINRCEPYLKDRLALHGIQVIVPDTEQDLKQIFQFIMGELGFNVFKDTTRAFFLEQVAKLVARGAEVCVRGSSRPRRHVPMPAHSKGHTAAPARLNTPMHTNARQCTRRC